MVRPKRKREPVWEADDVNRMFGCLDFSRNLTKDNGLRAKLIMNFLNETRRKEFAEHAIVEKLRELRRTNPRVIKRQKGCFDNPSRFYDCFGENDLAEIKKYKLQLSNHPCARIIQAEQRGLPPTSLGSKTPKTRIAKTVSRRGRKPSSKKSQRTPRVPKSRLQNVQAENSASRHGLSLPSDNPEIPDCNGPRMEVEIMCRNNTSAAVLPQDRPADNPDRSNEELRTQVSLIGQQLAFAHNENAVLMNSLHQSKAMYMRTSRELDTIQTQLEETSDRLLSIQLGESETTEALKKLTKESLAEKQKEILSLKRSLQKARDSEFFARLSVADASGPTGTAVESAIRSIESEIKTIIGFFHSNIIFQVPELDETDALSLLMRRSVGLPDTHLVCITSLESKLNPLGPGAVICSLIAAALCDWVFEDDFEALLVGQSMLLEEYRKHLSSIGRAESLRNIDLAAHKALFNSTDHQEVRIPFRAGTLATRFANTLAPLFKPSREEPNTQKVETWGLGQEDWELVSEALFRVFRISLALKVDLLLSTHRYFLVFFPSLAEFRSEWMLAESKAGDRAIEVPNGPLKVQLCVRPAIFVHSQGSLGLLDYTVPVRATIPEIAEDNDLQLILKGVAIPSSHH